MKKRNAMICLIAVLAVIIFMGYTAFLGLGSDQSGSFYDINLGLDLRGGVSITYQAVGEETPSDQDMEDTRNKLQKRVEGKSTEAQVYREGSDRITIDIPGATDANAILQELGKPGSLIFCTDASDVQGTKVMDGNQVKSAQGGSRQNTAGQVEYLVQLTLTPEGQKAFSEATAELASENKPIYIIYDGKVISAPAVKDHITGEVCSIDGMESLEAAEDLASTIRIGALPVELKELRSNVVGAKLGEEAVQTSLLAGAIGLAIVFLFMIIMYRIPGFAASIALVLYTGTIVVLLSAFRQEITLTLPGIAGIILGIGMAVDANVIIFARIREEIGKGRAVATAIDAGFSKALSAIIDGNVTTLIAAAVLYILGSGTVKGFAQTLALGIVLSMITALFITKTLLKVFYALGIQDEKFYGKTTNIKVINFLGKKNICFCLSAVIILVGLGTMIYHSMNGDAFAYSQDFKGGTSTSVTFNEAYDASRLEKEVNPVIAEVIGSNDIQASPVQNSNEVIFKTPELTLEQRTNLYNTLTEKFGVDQKLITNENISATVSNEMKSSAIKAVVIATIFMLLYIWFRFKDIRFASSSVIALLHDVCVVLACYAVFRWSVGNTFIACMLTIVGYSINATIVIFDRIRENLKTMGKKDSLLDVVNLSVSQTLSRSINTSLTTLVMIIVLFILGVTSIREFALPLMVGIVTGTYSSVCLASAFWYVLTTKFEKKSKK
ncbi:MAG: protein translocase subunit SecD [Clostridiales bacterium]|nr:protein translocase subunit SecD [Clostridiales bacterium]